MIAAVVLAPLAAALLPLALPLRRRRIARIVLAALAALAVVAIAPSLDGLARAFAALVSLLGALAVTCSQARGFFVGRAGDRVSALPYAGWSRVSVYFVLLGAFWSAMLLAVVATSFTVMWLGISATTLATAFLVAFSGETAALEAAWKYLILCSVGIAFVLLGLLVLAHVTLSAGIVPASALAWSAIAAHAPQPAPPLARIAIALMLVGFATKAGLVPMHAWLPDAHSKAPAPVSGLLSGVLVSCALYALMRTLQVADVLGCGDFARTILVWLGALSVLTAGALMLVQTDLKRLLAYSTVEHAGIVALALGFGGSLGELAALVHVLAHGFAKAGSFFAVGLVQAETGTTAIAELRGLWRDGPAGRLVLAGLAALAGMPPFGILVGELLVVVAGIAAGAWTVLALAFVGAALAFTALARTAIAIESGNAAERPARAPRRIRAARSAAALALAGAVAVALIPWTGLGGALEQVALGLTERAP